MDGLENTQPSGKQILAVFDGTAAMKSALADLNADEVLATLKAMPKSYRGMLLSAIGLRSAASVSRGMATQLLARMRSAAFPTDSDTVHSLSTLVVAALSLEDNPQSWIPLLGVDPTQALVAYTNSPGLAHIIEAIHQDLPAAVRRVGLLVALTSDSPGASVALSFLAHDDPAASAAHARLSDDFPELLPVAQLSFDDASPTNRLRAAGSLGEDAIWTADSIEEIAARVEESGLTGGDPLRDADDVDRDDGEDPEANDANGAEELIEDIEDLINTWPAHVDTANRIAISLRDGEGPDAKDLDSLLEFSDSLEILAETLDNGGSLQDLRTASDNLRAQIDAQDTAWLVDLANLMGPESTEDQLSAIRAVAEELLNSPGTGTAQYSGLRELHRLAQMGVARRNGENIDFAELSAAESSVRTHLPQMGPLILAALVGAIDWPDAVARAARPVAILELTSVTTVNKHADKEAQQDTGLHDRENPINVNMSEVKALAKIPLARPVAAVAPRRDEQKPSAEQSDAHEATDKSPTQPTVGVDFAPAFLSENTEEEGATAEPAGPRQAGPVSGAETIPASETMPTAPATSEVDLSDLDALLSAGAGAALRSLSHPHATRTVPGPHSLKSPTEPVVAQDVDDVLNWESSTVQDGYDNALADARFGLAADIAQAAGAPDVTIRATRIAAYATALRNATGQLAAAFAMDAPHLTRDALAENRSGQLLVWAAATRVALLAPGAGPAGILIDLAPCVANSAALAEVGHAFADASRAGLVVLPEAASAVGTLSAAETDFEDAAKGIADLLDGARQRVLKYVPANAIYAGWKSPDGPLGLLLTRAANGDAADVADLRDAALDQRGKAEKAIDSARNDRRKKVRIVGGARRDLLSRWDETLDAVDRWCAAAQRLADSRHAAQAGTWQAAPLNQVRTRLSVVRETALVEIASALGLDDNHTNGIRSAVVDLLTGAFAVCDGQAPTGDEPSPAFVAHHELLSLDLAVPADTLAPDGDVFAAQLPSLLALAARPALDAQETYQILASGEHHDLTAALIAGLRPDHPRDAAALDRQRVSDVAIAAAHTADEVDSLRSAIDTRRLDGALSDAVWSSMSASVEALDLQTRRDYGRIEALIADIRGALDHHRAERVIETLARIQDRAAEMTNVAEVSDKLTELASAGHIASAEEYLEQAIAGGDVPTFGTDVDHFTSFFPSVCNVADANPDLLRHLRETLAGAAIAPDVRALAQTGLDLDGLSATRREDGKRALGSWEALRAIGLGKGGSSDLGSPLSFVLAQAGLEFVKIHSDPPAGGRQWVTLSGVRAVGNALTPALGSAMSPDGATLRVLLVRSAPSPATVIEWMRAEAPDNTVLALWLPGALKVADRRDLANASRGRVHPPVVVMDAAALAYLIAQSEPRRSTFAAITLPFTAASPYRDTPGDAAPEMFYGRTDELAAVLDLRGPSMVSGGRQLGKSALLRTAERQFRDSGPARESVLTSLFTVGSDGDATKLWLSLWPLLAERSIVSGDAPPTGAGTAVHEGILSWLAGDSNRSLLILLDETDAFLDADAAGNQFTNVEWCRRIMEDSGRRAKVVFAGLHRTARFDSLPNQPLSHFGPAIVVGPLRPQHAYDLLTRPLQAVGFRFEDDSTPARVLALANNMPALLQLFGAALMEELTSQPLPPNTPVQLVTNADVDSVFNNAELKDAFREKYRLTLNLDPRYQVIAYTVAGAAHERGVDAGLTLTELSTDARSTWPAGFAGCGSDDFGGLVKECVDLGLLAVDDDRYRMRTPMVLRLLGTEDEVLGTLLNAPERLSVPSTADAGAYRRMIGNARSPLTERQLGALFATHGRTVVIAGSPALGNDRAISTVETALQLGAGRVAKFARAHTATPDGLRGTANKMGVAGLIMCDARTLTTTALTTLLHAGAALTEASPDLTIAVVTGPVNAPAWLNWPQRIDLTRWDASGLRMLCDEENLPFRDSTTQSDLLAATGGWPPLLGRAIEACHGSGAVPSGEQILSHVEAWIDSAAASELLDAAGVGTAAPVLRAALARISELTNSVGEDTANLAELLEMADEDLTPSCQEAGFANLEEVIVALAALACLFDDGQGGWRAEGQISTIVQTCAGVEA